MQAATIKIQPCFLPGMFVCSKFNPNGELIAQCWGISENECLANINLPQ